MTYMCLLCLRTPFEDDILQVGVDDHIELTARNAGVVVSTFALAFARPSRRVRSRLVNDTANKIMS